MWYTESTARNGFNVSCNSKEICTIKTLFLRCSEEAIIPNDVIRDYEIWCENNSKIDTH